MSIHIGAERGDVAPIVLLPGDPMRAKFFAERFLENAVCFNEVRGMLGFTGSYNGQRISIMGSGMGMPSMSIYAHELITDFGAKALIRVGTCGGMQPDLKLGDILLPMAASTDSSMNRRRFEGMDFAPCADFDLLLRARSAAEERGIDVRIGGVLSADNFYEPNPEWWKRWAAYGVLACEMESSALYTIAAGLGVAALSILTVSDDLVSGEAASSQDRETAYPRMAELALAAVAGIEEESQG